MPENNPDLANLIKTTAANKELSEHEYLEFISTLSQYFKSLELIDVEITHSKDERIRFENASLLHIAAFYNNKILIDYLLQAKKCLDIDASCFYKITHKDGNSLSAGGNTPLQIAARFNAPAAIKKLIERHADELPENDDHKTAIELTKSENIELFNVKTIKNYKAKVDQRFDLYDKLAVSKFFLGLAIVVVPILMLNILFPPVALVSAIGLVATVCTVGAIYLGSSTIVVGIFAANSINKARQLNNLSDSLGAIIADKEQKQLGVKEQLNSSLDNSISGKEYANLIVKDKPTNHLPTYEEACQGAQAVLNIPATSPGYNPPSYEESCRLRFV